MKASVEIEATDIAIMYLRAYPTDTNDILTAQLQRAGLEVDLNFVSQRREVWQSLARDAAYVKHMEETQLLTGEHDRDFIQEVEAELDAESDEYFT